MKTAVAIIKKLRAFSRRVAVGVLRKFGFRLGNWKDHLPHETVFWANALEDPERNWRISEYRLRTDPHAEFQEELKKLVKNPGETIKILDVGAGPLTRLGKKWVGFRIEITAVDPLASAYDQILEKVSLVPIVRTIHGEGEKLAGQFPKDYFDLAYSSNALDHSYNPLLAIEQMLEVVKPGGSVYLWHFRNEGSNAAYQGLHQWNFDAKDNDFLIDDGVRTEKVGAKFKGEAQLTCRLISEFGVDVVETILTKHQDQ